MHPHNAPRVAIHYQTPTAPRAHRTELTAHLTHVVTERVQRIQPETRGVGCRQTQRIRDAKRGRPYSLSNLLALVADLTLDPRIATDDIDAIFADLSLEVRRRRGETADAPELWDALQRETSAQALADLAVHNALRTGDAGAVAAALSETQRHVREATLVAFALRERIAKVAPRAD